MNSNAGNSCTACPLAAASLGSVTKLYIHSYIYLFHRSFWLNNAIGYRTCQKNCCIGTGCLLNTLIPVDNASQNYS
jgi:hypothetical protein